MIQREVQKNGEEIPTNRKKQKRGNRDNTTPVARNQKEELLDLWCLPENANFNSLFDDNAKGNAIVAKISDFNFRHHQKKGKDYKNTPLCIPYAIGQLCPKGKGCSNNHSWRKDLRSLATQRNNVSSVDSLITDHYK